ncbi:MAG TPA: tetratricopeptide repeat protein, partial [Bacteroidia bacterium]|nr:tetratricopeptide repeat protein [Bacteroidia bacterium]
MTRKFLPLLAILALVFTSKLSAQKDVELVNSGQVLYDGNLYYYTGHYQKAEEEFRKVGRNDTNYAEVLRDLALTYSDDKEDSLCAITCRAGIALESVYSPDFYNLLGISLKEMNQTDSAIKVFDKAIELYPYTYVLYYQKGMTYYKKKDYKEAEKWFQTAIKINPYHAASHFQLGKICAEEGRLIPAMLSYEFYLMLDPSTQSDRAKKVVSQME